MYEAEDHEFFDELYRLWSQTSGAESSYWIVEEQLHEYMQYWVMRYNPDTKEKLVIGSFHNEEDADFVAGLHGAMPDLIRRLHEAIDEAVRKDEENDIAQGALADVLLENTDLRNQLYELEKQ